MNSMISAISEDSPLFPLIALAASALTVAFGFIAVYVGSVWWHGRHTRMIGPVADRDDLRFTLEVHPRDRAWSKLRLETRDQRGRWHLFGDRVIGPSAESFQDDLGKAQRALLDRYDTAALTWQVAEARRYCDSLEGKRP